MSITLLKNSELFEEFIKTNDLVVVHFFADWTDHCKQMNEFLNDLSSENDYKSVKFGKVEAEEVADISKKYKIEAVPTIIILKNSSEVGRVNGVNPEILVEKIKSFLASENETTIEDRLKKLINQAPCMLFMKGDPTTPRCGFSKTIIGILNEMNADYQSFDILQDNAVREGLKKFSKWPTYPQLYVNGELIGGLDIVKEMNESGDLVEILPKKIE